MLRLAQNQSVHETGPLIALVQCPALVIDGTRDPVIRAWTLDLMCEHLPDARALELPGGTHALDGQPPRRDRGSDQRAAAGAGEPLSCSHLWSSRQGLGCGMPIQDPPARADLPREQTWDIEAIFATPDAWEEEAAAFPAALDSLKTYAGRLGESPETLLSFFQTDQTLRQRLGRLTSYASMTASVDGQDTGAADRRDRGNVLASQYTAASAFANPELLALDEATLRGWLKRPELQEFAVPLQRLWRTRPHVRSAEVEELLGALGSPFGSARNIHPTLANMDLDFGSVDGVKIGHGNIDALSGSADRETRRRAWEQYADAHLSVKHGMAAALATGCARTSSPPAPATTPTRSRRR